MDAGRRQELIARYREGPAVVEAVVAGLADEDLDHVPADGGWSAREVIHHLGDSQMISAVRLRKLVAEDSPTIQGYDEKELARGLHYRSRPPGPSLAALRAATESTATILDRLSEEDWGRTGHHTERGPYSVEDWLEIHASHAHDHAEQIERAVAEGREERL
jgi:DinB superfamily